MHTHYFIFFNASIYQMTAFIDNTKSILNYNYVIKCIFLGEPCAGKTSVIAKLVGEKFNNCSEPTIGIDFRSLSAIGLPKYEFTPTTNSAPLLLHNPQTEKTHYKIQLWDCSGQIRYRSIVRSYYRSAQIVFAMFDLTDRVSFTSITEWVNDFRENTIPDMRSILILIGNKKDLVDRFHGSAVSDDEINELIQNLKCDLYMEVSAKTGENIDKIFNLSISLLHQSVIDGSIKLKEPDIFVFSLEDSVATKRQFCCN